MVVFDISSQLVDSCAHSIYFFLESESRHRGDGGGWWYILYHFEDMILESYEGRHGMACEISSLVWFLILTFFLLSFLLSHFLHPYLSHSWFIFICRRECNTSDHEGNIRKCIRPNKYTLLESITVLYNIFEIIKFFFSLHSLSFSISLSHFLAVSVKQSHWFDSYLSFPFSFCFFLCVCLSLYLYLSFSLLLALFLMIYPFPAFSRCCCYCCKCLPTYNPEADTSEKERSVRFPK